MTTDDRVRIRQFMDDFGRFYATSFMNSPRLNLEDADLTQSRLADLLILIRLLRVQPMELETPRRLRSRLGPTGVP